MAYIIEEETISYALDETYTYIAGSKFVIVQCDATIRLKWSQNGSAYHTYEAMTEPVVLPAGFYVCADDTSANLVVTGASNA
jgi:hypothetical protein